MLPGSFSGLPWRAPWLAVPATDPAAAPDVAGYVAVYPCGTEELAHEGAGPVRDAVLLNAAAAIAAFDSVVSSAHAAIEHGLPFAVEAIDSGAASKLLDAWIAASSALATR